MKALKKPVRHLAVVETQANTWSDLSIDDFEDLFELADDAYLASLDAHLATLDYADSDHTEAP